MDEKHVMLLDTTQESAISSANSETPSTEEKKFTSDTNPHDLKQAWMKGQYLWFGTYAHWLSNAQMSKALDKCRDKSKSIETVSIHLKDYSLKYFVGSKDKSLPLISKTEKGVILIKLYLLKRE